MTPRKTTSKPDVHADLEFARERWQIDDEQSELLRSLIARFGFSPSAGDVVLLDGKWYPTHSGLLALAHRVGCDGLVSRPIPALCRPSEGFWVFACTVYRRGGARFSAYGDASAKTVPAALQGAELRIAETRAVNRALRKAYAVGLCSAEELAANGSGSRNSRRPPQSDHSVSARLFGLIREFSLDSADVKRYALAHLGTPSFREATREQVEAFVSHFAEELNRDPAAIRAKLRAREAGHGV